MQSHKISPLCIYSGPRVPCQFDPREKRNKFWGPFLRCKSAPIHGRNSSSRNSTQRAMPLALNNKKFYQSELQSRGKAKD